MLRVQNLSMSSQLLKRQSTAEHITLTNERSAQVTTEERRCGDCLPHLVDLAAQPMLLVCPSARLQPASSMQSWAEHRPGQHLGRDCWLQLAILSGRTRCKLALGLGLLRLPGRAEQSSEQLSWHSKAAPGQGLPAACQCPLQPQPLQVSPSAHWPLYLVPPADHSMPLEMCRHSLAWLMQCPWCWRALVCTASGAWLHLQITTCFCGQRSYRAT